MRRNRIAQRISHIRQRRVKPASRLHAPRVYWSYIEVKYDSCKPLPVNRLLPSFTQQPDGRGRGARTPDLRFWRPPLYQLSYTPIRLVAPCAVGRPLPKSLRAVCKGGLRALSPVLRNCFHTSCDPPRHRPGNRFTAKRAAQGRPFQFFSKRPPCSDYSVMAATMPAPTVRPPSRIAKRSFSSMAIGTISVTSTVTLSPGMTISVPSGSVTMPVTSVVRK